MCKFTMPPLPKQPLEMGTKIFKGFFFSLVEVSSSQTKALTLN